MHKLTSHYEKYHTLRSECCHLPWVLLFFDRAHSSKLEGILGQATSLLFCRCLKFPFNASSCNLTQCDASSRTLSQKTNNPGLGELKRSLNSISKHRLLASMWSPKISSWDFCAIKKHQGATTKISSSSLLPHLKTSTPCANVISNNIDMRLLRNQKSPEQNTKKYRHCCHLSKNRDALTSQPISTPDFCAKTRKTSVHIPNIDIYFHVIPEKHHHHALLRSPKIQSYLHIPSPISLFVWIAIEHVNQRTSRSYPSMSHYHTSSQ